MKSEKARLNFDHHLLAKSDSFLRFREAEKEVAPGRISRVLKVKIFIITRLCRKGKKNSVSTDNLEVSGESL